MVSSFDDRRLFSPFLLRLTFSFAVALLAITAIGVLTWIASDRTAFDFSQLPKALSLFLGLSGAYAAIGALFLYVFMWIYLIGFDRGSLWAKAGWAAILIFLVHYGALIYYFVVLSRFRRNKAVS